MKMGLGWEEGYKSRFMDCFPKSKREILKLTNEFSGSAVHIEWIITFFLIRISIFKEQAVGAKFGLRDSINTLVVLLKTRMVLNIFKGYQRELLE
jgi:hypothetical protein